MKAYHYLISWLCTLFLGVIFNLILLSGDSEAAIAFSLAAAVFSLPFIILFALVMWAYLRSKPDKIAVHLITFMVHVLGGFLTFIAMLIIFGDLLPDEFTTVVFMYFVIDSIFFHSLIEMKHPVKQGNGHASSESDEDILDAPL